MTADTRSMPIERGADWGAPGRLPADAPLAHSDTSLAALVRRGVGQARLGGGDLARTLGVGATRPSETYQLLPVDAIDLRLDDGPELVCVAHAVAGSLIVSSEVVAIMNAAFIETANLAPRAHPGDGLADVVTMKLGLADRLKARRRMTTGTHVPHPNITIRRQDRGTIEFSRPHTVRVDGRRMGRVTRIDFRVRTRAITVGV